MYSLWRAFLKRPVAKRSNLWQNCCFNVNKRPKRIEKDAFKLNLSRLVYRQSHKQSFVSVWSFVLFCFLFLFQIADLANEDTPQLYAACGRGPRSSMRVLRHGLEVRNLHFTHGWCISQTFETKLLISTNHSALLPHSITHKLRSLRLGHCSGSLGKKWKRVYLNGDKRALLGALIGGFQSGLSVSVFCDPLICNLTMIKW